jgi:hypothetical protein
MRKALLAVVLLTLPRGTLAQDVNPTNTKQFVPLADVVKVVQETLIAAQAQLAGTKSLPISIAEFDFQATTTSDSTLGVTAVVSADVEHEIDSSQEIDYTYQVPTPPTVIAALASADKQKANRFFAATRPFASKASDSEPPQVVDVVTAVQAALDWFKNVSKPASAATLNKSLLAAIVAAGKSMADAQVVNTTNGQGLPLATYVVTISYTVTNTISGGIDASSLIVVSPTAKYNGSQKNVQTVKLTFGKS